MPWPSILSALTDPLPTQRQNSPSHSSIETNQNTAIEEIQTFVGTSSSALGTLMYDIRAAASNGGGHVQTANKGGTGQTSFTKGDILVAQSTSVLTKLAAGTDGYIFVADSSQNVGVKWVAPTASALGIIVPTIRVATVTSVWSKPSLLSYLIVEVVGGGGGGGGCLNAVSHNGGGGGGGGYSRKRIASSILGATENITIGAAGTAGAGGAGAGDGGTGGTTVFGASSILYATGGSGGQVSSNGGNGRAGGIGFSGDLNSAGDSGGWGLVAANGHGGNGGGSHYGGGGASAGGNAQVYGGGGGGGEGNGSPGGNASAGVTVITEYYA